MNATLRKYISILALSLAGGSIYTLPYIKYVFYDTQLEVMNITNMQSGFLLSMYALGCILSYIPGGIITDKISPRKAISYSLFGTAALGALYAITLSYTLALVIWFLFALTTAFVFWTSLLKAIGMAGDSTEQARLYGLYYAGNGIAAAIVNSLALEAFTFGSDPRQSLFYAVMVMSVSILVSGILVFFILSDEKTESAVEDKFDFSAVKHLFKNPMLWIFSFIVFGGYAIYSSTSYFTPYLTSVVGLSVEESGVYSIIRSYLFYLLAPFGGYLADKVFRSTSKLFIVLFATLALTIGGVLFLPPTMSTTAISLYTLLPGAFGLMLYGLVFSVVREAGIPITVAGTAIGIASIIGYTPDFFFSAMFGSWLDSHGDGGYAMIFTFLAAVAAMGCVMSIIVCRWGNKAEENLPLAQEA
ncbi:MFS transporter [Desulforhopalus singaporensis]|uniref:Nitrate/nitrite transporter NarK n=1 Tax=Desulforhopalus singaporensis TaxID=91360 RepID=A0A1H0SCG5_9BACT|nr:MFS transporter [Desulforhopalus singaporensis]SDP39199.1 Nitrate/nitrite transporter NarK [Desulforhopalus singaporensis]